MKIPLEDTYQDILQKAVRGQKLTPEAIAAGAGLSAQHAAGVLSGAFDEPGAIALAEALGLESGRLVRIAKNEYHPAEIERMAGLSQFNTPFNDMTVNSYLVWDPASQLAIAFDTGTDVSGMLQAVTDHALSLDLILLTHSHGDHIFELDRLKEKTGATAYIGEAEAIDGAIAFVPGKEFQLGALRIETRLTWGHSKGGITYVIHGLSRTIAIVGDAMFAGSMGGGGVSYQDALATNRKEILSLPDETVICPGHGPLTTVGEQKKHNPFFP